MEDAGIPRPTVRRRRTVRAVVWDDPTPGFPAHDDYVRRFWTAVIGPGAVADLLRLMAAAGTDRELKRPVSLPELARAGLARGSGDTISVRAVVPLVPPDRVRQFPTSVRQAHARATR